VLLTRHYFVCRPIIQAIEKTSNTPKSPQPRALSKLDTKSTSSSTPTKKNPASLSNQPRRGGVVGEIAKDATGVAIVAITKHSSLLDTYFEYKK